MFCIVGACAVGVCSVGIGLALLVLWCSGERGSRGEVEEAGGSRSETTLLRLVSTASLLCLAFYYCLALLVLLPPLAIENNFILVV